MPCYLRVKNHRIGQRRFIRADIPPDTPKVSAGVFHHPFRIFRLEGSLPAVPGQTAGFALLIAAFSMCIGVVTTMRCGPGFMDHPEGVSVINNRPLPQAARLMRRPGFEYKKPLSLPAQADEARQAAFIAMYEALMRDLEADGMGIFSDAVHPEHRSRPAHGWFPKGQKTALKATSGRKRLNIQGAPDLEIFQFTFVEGEKINAQTTRAMLEKPERNNPTKATIHVFVDNARYHHARILQPWLHSPVPRVKLKFLPAYAPHLNPIKRLWGVMHEWITHNRHYATFDQFTEAIFNFFGQTLPDKWRDFRDTVTDNFRIVSRKEYKLI